MNQRDQLRVARLERELLELRSRVELLEPPRRVASTPPSRPPAAARPPATRPAEPAPAPTQPATIPSPRRPSAGERLQARFGEPGFARQDLEDLVGGRVLAWVGGLAVLVGLVLLFAVAVSSGWLGEGARVLMGAVASTVFVCVGVWLHERRARTDAALACVAVGVSGQFVTATVATQVYELVPDLAGLAVVLATGAVATLLAVRWESRGIAALGILGGLAAPVLTGAELEAGTVAIIFVALASAAGVLVWKRWDWLALAAFALAVPQWSAFVFGDPGVPAILVTLTAFGGLGIVVAVGHDVRVRSDAVPLASAFLLGLNALAVGGIGAVTLHALGEPEIGNAWLATLAAAHMGVGLCAHRLPRVSGDLGLLALVIGVLLADTAFALIADGLPLVAGWVITGVAFAILVRRLHAGSHARHEGALASTGLGGHLCLALVPMLALAEPARVLEGSASVTAAGAVAVALLAAGCLVSGRLAAPVHPAARTLLDAAGLAAVAVLTALLLDGSALVAAWLAEVATLTLIAVRGPDRLAGFGALGFLGLAAWHVLVLDVPPDAFASGTHGLPALLALAGVALAAFVLGRCLPVLLLDSESESLRLALDGTGLAAAVYLTAVLLAGPALVAALSVEAVALALLSRRFGDRVAGGAAVGLLAGAALLALFAEVPPTALLTGLAQPAAAVAALGSVAAAALLVGEPLAPLHPKARTLAHGAAVLVLLYLASALVVTPFESGDAVDSALLSAHQQGQMVLSVFWALVGVCTLVLGLRKDLAALRLAGLALLGVTVAKVFLFDLATLTSVYRVVSFVGLGVLLLAGAFIWQCLRPRALPDLRETPTGLR